jgi:hypothetical protein
VKELLFQRMEAKVIIPAALQALQDKNDSVRVLAMELLAYKGRDDDRTVPALIKMLRDESSFVRENAVIELKHIGDPRAMPALVQALRDEDKWVRAEAVKAVGKYGSLKDATDLIPALLDKSWDVCEQAEKSLLNILSRLQLPDDFQQRRLIISFLRWLSWIIARIGYRTLPGSILQTQSVLKLTTSPWQDPLQPPPVPAWARAARWAGRGLVLFFLVGLLAVTGVLLAGAQDVLKEAVLPYLQSQPLAWVMLILVSAAALVVLGEWVREKMVR